MTPSKKGLLLQLESLLNIYFPYIHPAATSIPNFLFSQPCYLISYNLASRLLADIDEHSVIS